jgi:predicted Fe-Mo cluster-binding NifX family protein
MLVALTVWEDRISPLFEATRRVLVVHVQGCRIIDRYYTPFDSTNAIDRAALLDELGVNLLICGGISNFSENLIKARGIQVLAFASGSVEKVLDDYLTGRLDLKTPTGSRAGLTKGEKKLPVEDGEMKQQSATGAKVSL